MSSTFLTILLYILVAVGVSYADTAQLKAIRIQHHAQKQMTRMTLAFDRKVDYEQIPGAMLIEVKLLNTTKSDFSLPNVSRSDSILKDFKLNQYASDTVSLLLVLHKPAKLYLSRLLSPHRLVIELKPAIGMGAIAQTQKIGERPPDLVVKDSATQKILPHTAIF